MSRFANTTSATIGDLPARLKIYFTVMFTCNAFASTLLNVIVLVVFYRNQSLRNAPNTHIRMLAVADLVIGTTLSTVCALQTVLQDNALFYIIGNSLNALVCIPGFIVGAIGYDRYTRIKNVPMSKLRFRLLLTLPWLSTGVFLLSKTLGVDLWLAVFICVAIVFLLVYFAAKNVCFSRRNSTTQNKSMKLTVAKNRKATHLLVLLTSSFCATITPLLAYRMFLLLYNYHPNGFDWLPSHSSLLRAIAQLTFQVNSVVNPFLYFGKHEKMRKALRYLFKATKPTAAKN